MVRRLSDPAARRELAQRIQIGEGFDDIAKLAGWDGIYLTSLHCPEDHPYLGKSLAEIAAMTGQDPLTCCCDLLVREQGEITMIDFMASEEDITAILQSPLSHLISDATYPTEGMPHPRVYGTFPRLLQHFVREKGVLTWEQAIHKMTGRPAQRLRLAGKGVLAAGMDADLCVFDPEALRETGTYQEPCRMAAGMDTVFLSLHTVHSWRACRCWSRVCSPALVRDASSGGKSYAGEYHRYCAPGRGAGPQRQRRDGGHP